MKRRIEAALCVVAECRRHDAHPPRIEIIDNKSSRVGAPIRKPRSERRVLIGAVGRRRGARGRRQAMLRTTMAPRRTRTRSWTRPADYPSSTRRPSLQQLDPHRSFRRATLRPFLKRRPIPRVQRPDSLPPNPKRPPGHHPRRPHRDVHPCSLRYPKRPPDLPHRLRRLDRPCLLDLLHPPYRRHRRLRLRRPPHRRHHPHHPRRHRRRRSACRA
jgi:hypothetical protein